MSRRIMSPISTSSRYPSHNESGRCTMRQLPQVDQVLKAAIDRGDVPGVVAMAATREGPVYQGAFGKRALPDGALMTSDTVFWIASMTKAVTSTAAMQLVAEGKLT